MRAVLLISFSANVFLALLSLAILPERVAIHFGADGTPNGWASNLQNTLMMLAFHVLVFCAIYFAPTLISNLPSKWINLPNRNYWLAPARRAQAVDTFRRYLWQFGGGVFLFMLFAGLLVIRANLSDPVRFDERLFLLALGGFLAYTTYWIIALLRAFRIPR